MHLPSDAIVAKSYGAAVSSGNAESASVTLEASKKYVVRGVDSTDEKDLNDQTNEPSTYAIRTALDDLNLPLLLCRGSSCKLWRACEWERNRRDNSNYG